MILGILTNALRINRVHSYKGILLALLICILYAISDEIHQIFVPGRSGEIRDVVIDSSGSSTGILVYSIVSQIIERMNRKALKMSGIVKYKISFKMKYLLN